MRRGVTNLITLNKSNHGPLVLKNSSPAAVYTLPNTIIYLKVENYLNIRLKIRGCKRLRIEYCTMARRFGTIKVLKNSVVVVGL